MHPQGQSTQLAAALLGKGRLRLGFRVVGLGFLRFREVQAELRRILQLESFL